MLEDDQDIPTIREGIKSLCEKFPEKYWRETDRSRSYPKEFVKALSDHGYLGCLIPEKYGGSGQKLRAAAVILEEIHRSGGNGAACHAQMYIMGTLLRHGSEVQKQKYLPGIAEEVCGFRLLELLSREVEPIRFLLRPRREKMVKNSL